MTGFDVFLLLSLACIALAWDFNLTPPYAVLK